MITSINKIKRLGLVFPDYVWNSDLPKFKRYNLIYGWNGSGKTTLSKLFDALETGELLRMFMTKNIKTIRIKYRSLKLNFQNAEKQTTITKQPLLQSFP